MNKFLRLTLIVCTLFACNLMPSFSPQPTPLVTEVDPEEYAIFSAMIEQGVAGYNLGGPVLICDQTLPDINSLETALRGPHKLPKELVEAYRLRNEQPYTLDSNFTLKQSYSLMPQSEYDDLVRTGRTNWTDFHTKYPESGGFYVFSRAGLNAARDEALVSIAYFCGDLCAEGGVVLMVKEDGVWKLEREFVSWMA